MANPITEALRRLNPFRREQDNKITEVIEVQPEQEEKKEVTESLRYGVGELILSNKNVLSSTDVSTEDEGKLLDLYDKMDNDAVISAALDLFADNASQINNRTGKIVSIKSADLEFQDEINDFLQDVVNIDSKIRDWIREMLLYGKIILDTNAAENGKAWGFFPVEDPHNIKILKSGDGEVKYFAVKEQSDSDLEKDYGGFYATPEKRLSEVSYSVEPASRYIVELYKEKRLGKMVLADENEANDIQTTKEIEESERSETVYVVSGKSLLAPVVSTWQTLSALEDALFINRLTKATAFKIVQVDVSGSSNKDAKKIMDSVKNAFKSSETLDLSNNNYKNRHSQVVLNDFVFIPKKGEKATVTVDEVGGSMGEIDTTDIDYYRNKEFAGLGVLKAFLGFEETTPGGMGETALSKLDERFGRRVITIQSKLKNIVRQIIDFYWSNSDAVGRSSFNIPKYEIMTSKVSTAQEEEASKRLSESITTATSFIGLAQNQTFEEFINKEKLFNFVFNNIIGIDVADIDNTPADKDIKVKLHDLQSKIKVQANRTISKKGKRSLTENNHTHDDEDHYIEGKIKDLLTFDKMLEFLKEAKERPIYLVDEKDNKVLFEHSLLRHGYKKVLTEKSYTQLKNLSKTLDPRRISKSKKSVAKYTGVDKQGIVSFVITAEDPKANAEAGRPTSYDLKVRLLDLDYVMQAAASDNEPMSDKDIVQLALQGDVAVSCSCPAAKYWGQQWNGTKDGYSLDKNNIAPTRNVPTQPLCKHTILMLTVLPFWWNSIVRDFRQLGLIGDKGKKTPPKPQEEEPKVDNQEQQEVQPDVKKPTEEQQPEEKVGKDKLKDQASKKLDKKQEEQEDSEE